MEAKTCLDAANRQKQREMGNLILQKGALPKLLHIVFSQEDRVPESGKPMAMK